MIKTFTQISIFVFLMLAMIFFYFSLFPNNYFKVRKIVHRKSISEQVKIKYSAGIEIIKYDLQTYNNISSKMIDVIIGGIEKSSAKYNIPVGLIHAIIRTESNYEWWIVHKQIIVNGKKTKAVGLGGIVWEYWSKKLIENNIAKKRSDLFDPVININSVAYILSEIVKINIKNKKMTKWNVVDKIISNYYGVFNKEYKNKLIQYTSDLWMKRISSEIFNKYKKSFEIKLDSTIVK